RGSAGREAAGRSKKPRRAQARGRWGGRQRRGGLRLEKQEQDREQRVEGPAPGPSPVGRAGDRGGPPAVTPAPDDRHHPGSLDTTILDEQQFLPVPSPRRHVVRSLADRLAHAAPPMPGGRARAVPPETSATSDSYREYRPAGGGGDELFATPPAARAGTGGRRAA